MFDILSGVVVGSTPTRGIFVISPDKVLLISYQGCCDKKLEQNAIYDRDRQCVVNARTNYARCMLTMLWPDGRPVNPLYPP
jgi:hypothetical protein